jgi:hypothetical protein
MVARHINPVASRAQEDTVSHPALQKALVAAAMAVALAVPATAAAAGGVPLIVPISSSEHATPDAMAAPASSSEHTAGSPTALIVPGTNTEHRVTPTAALTRGTSAPPSKGRWDVLAAAGVLLAVLAAALIVIRLQLRTRDVAV